jgi:hypothetical protein
MSAFIELLTAFFQFPQEILQFVKLLRKTPQQKHDDLLQKMADEAQKLEDTGRPTWN